MTISYTCLPWHLFDIVAVVWYVFEPWNPQGPWAEPFEDDLEKEMHYADILRMNSIDIIDDAAVEAEMEAALKEYSQIGSDLGIIPLSCKSLSEDPSWVTRWIIGDEKLDKVQKI